MGKTRPYQTVIGQAIRRYRSAAQLSQEELAEAANLHPVYFGQVERGEQTISIGALLRIAQALKIRLRDLVKDV